jgi:hypothetical protein
MKSPRQEKVVTGNYEERPKRSKHPIGLDCPIGPISDSRPIRVRREYPGAYPYRDSRLGRAGSLGSVYLRSDSNATLTDYQDPRSHPSIRVFLDRTGLHRHDPDARRNTHIACGFIRRPPVRMPATISGSQRMVRGRCGLFGATPDGRRPYQPLALRRFLRTAPRRTQGPYLSLRT